MASPAPDLLTLLGVLLEHQVELIVVGGVAAVLQGVPVTTVDLDVVHLRSVANVERLLQALAVLVGEDLEALLFARRHGLHPRGAEVGVAAPLHLVVRPGEQ